VGDLPVLLGELDAIPPGIRYRLRTALARLPRDGGALDGAAQEHLARLVADGQPWLGAEPALAELGHWMIEPRHDVELRRRGCAWLAMFPSRDTVAGLGRLALDPATPTPVREEAIRALGDRQLRDRHPSTWWSPDAVQLADEVLGKLADAATGAGRIHSAQLPRALRHVQSDMTAAIFAKAPWLWGDALECFATPPLARVLFVSLGEIPAQHRVRVLRLVAATLGEEAVPLLVSRAADAPLEERLEMLFLALSFGGERYLGRLDEVVRGMRQVEPLRQRATWHLAHPRVVPTVRGLRVARTVGVLAPSERPASCRQAADDLGVLTRFARHPEAYLYTLWARMVRLTDDPARARELVHAHPGSQHLVGELYLEDLARRGRVQELISTAHALGLVERGALALAIWGRPLAALELGASSRRHTPELVCARALACHRAGRPELAARILTADLPPSELVDDAALAPFPGPHERWCIDRAADAHPALVALAGGLSAVAALARPAPLDAEPDRTSLEPIRDVSRRLARPLAGATVYLAGDFAPARRDALGAAAAQVGARLVAGPLPGTDYYVADDACSVQTIARLERRGLRRLLPGELGGG